MTGMRPAVSGSADDLVLRSRRVVTPVRRGRPRSCVADGRIAAIEDYAAPGRGSAATWCCCPAWSTPTCTSTSPAAPSGRASPPRPGPPPPAASPRSSTCRSTRIPPTDDVGGAGGQAARPRPASARSTSASGAARCPATSARLRRAARRRACSASSASCVDSGRRRVPAAGRRRSSTARCAEVAALDALLIVHAEDAARARRGAGAAGRVVRRLPRVPAAGGRGRARSPLVIDGGPADRRPGAHPAPVQRRRAADCSRAARARRGAGHRRDLPALPDASPPRRSPTARPQFKCCPPIRDAGQPRRAVGRRCADGRHRLRRVRPLALHPRAEAARHRRLRRGLGRHRLAAARPAARCGPQARAPRLRR